MSSKRKNTKPKRRKSASPAKNRDREEKSPVLPPRKTNNWQFPAVVIVVIAIPLAGFWWYQSVMTAPQNGSLNESSENDSVTNNDKNHSTDTRQAQRSLTTGWETEVGRQQKWNQIDNAAEDGWETEVINQRVNDAFAKLKKVITAPGEKSLLSAGFLVAEGVTFEPLRPTSLTIVFDDDVLVVQRGNPETSTEGDSQPSGPNAKTASLEDAIRDLKAPYRDPQALRLKIKVFRVEQGTGGFSTEQSVEIFGSTEDGLMEENATWRAEWLQTDNGPVLRTLEVTDYESVSRPGKALFSDCTQSLMGANECFNEQLLRGYNFWLERSQSQGFFGILGNPGLALGDVNNDGLEDLYICQEGGLPNLLFVQNPDGTLRDASPESGANWLQNSRTALIVDLNNDGHRDLAVAVTGGVVIASGDGTGQFAMQTVLDSNDDVMSLAAADFDLDGWLDLYVGVYYQNSVASENEDVALGDAEFVFHNANNGGRNSLFRNRCVDGQWSFADVTDPVGLDANNTRWTLASSWEDFDNDGDPDLYVANDYGVNNLYRNELQEDGSRRFVDIAAASDTEDSASGMSVSWGDYDLDGWMDLYVSNMFSYAGNRITFQNQFKADADEETRKRFQRFARGNTLMRNPGKWDPDRVLRFEDRTLQASVNRARWAWGSMFVDLNNDRWQDLVVANGYITTEDSGDL